MSKLYPVGIQNFEKLRKDGYCYIDKTDLIYRLVTTGQYYFLGRPRRFGKSLLISTIEAYFQGKKDLFNGLAAGSLEKEWRQYPVLHFDLNAKKFDDTDDLYSLLDRQLLEYERVYGSEADDGSLEGRFIKLIRTAVEKTGLNAVVLIDEYDKPLLQAIGNIGLQNAYRDTLKAFYSVLKSADGYIRFAFLTGVTKFGKVSIFSDLNNLEDISMNPCYSSLCGITDAEIREYFQDEVEYLAKANRQSIEDTYAKLKDSYDGYHFCEDVPGVYNPFSLLVTLKNGKYGSYWFETGTPTYLVELLKRNRYNLEKMSSMLTSAAVINGLDSPYGNPIAVIYQSGYLTIKGYDRDLRLYRLGFPNREVEEGFMNFLLPYYTDTTEDQGPYQIGMFVREVRAGDIDSFMERLQSLMADTPYEIVKDLENHYQNVIFIITKLLGFYVNAEYHTSNGRIDLVIKTPDYIYVMEFKFNGTAEDALRQIDEKGYALPFAKDRREVYRIGVNFSGESRNIDRWIVSKGAGKLGL